MDNNLAPWRTTRGAAIISTNDKKEVVLVRRLSRPLVGIWTVPMGHTESGETLEQAAIREMKEETGLDAKVIRLLHIFHNEQEDVTLHLYYGEVISNDLPKADTDVSEAKYFRVKDLPEIPLGVDFPKSEEWALEIHKVIIQYIYSTIEDI